MEDNQLQFDVKLLSESLGVLPEPAAEPYLIVVSGLPGTGKSYFCKKLAERLPVVILESDALRKVLFSPHTYDKKESARLFQAIHLLIKKLLKKGISIVLDATNLSERYRERLYNIAYQLNTKLLLVWVEAPPELVRERLAARKVAKDNSDADWRVYQRMKLSAEKISRNHFVVDTSRDITPVIDKIVKKVSR